MSKQTIARDLAKHLSDKINTALTDYFERCSDMEVNYDDAMALALTVLGTHLTAGARDIHATEKEFVYMCRWHFHNVQQSTDG
jgi:hypothetical protein